MKGHKNMTERGGCPLDTGQLSLIIERPHKSDLLHNHKTRLMPRPERGFNADWRLHNAQLHIDQSFVSFCTLDRVKDVDTRTCELFFGDKSKDTCCTFWRLYHCNRENIFFDYLSPCVQKRLFFSSYRSSYSDIVL